MATPLSRRTVTQGLAWTVPAVAAAASAPAFAASPCSSAAAIDGFFLNYQTALRAQVAPCGVNNDLVIWYDGPGGANGALQNMFLNVRNETGCAIDLTSYPLRFRIDVKNLTGVTDRFRQFSNTNSYGEFSTLAAPMTRVAGTRGQRNFSWTTESGAASPTPTGIYSVLWTANRDGNFGNGEDADIQWSWEDGLSAYNPATDAQGTTSSRLTNAVRLVPLGFEAPQWAAVQAATGATADCRAYYDAKVATWLAEGRGCIGLDWFVATNVDTITYGTRTKWTKTPIGCGTGIWSNVAKDFTPGHDGVF